MPKLIGILLIVLSLPLTAEQTLIFGVREDLPTQYYANTDPPSGIFPEILGTVFQPLNIKLEYQSSPRRRIIHQMRAGQMHLSTLPIIPGHFDKLKLPDDILVSEEPIMAFEVAFYKLSSRNIELTRDSDLAPYLIGSARHPKFMLNALDEFFSQQVNFEFYSKSENLLKALLSNRVDFALLSEPVSQKMLTHYPQHIHIEKALTIGKAFTHISISESSLGKEQASALMLDLDKMIKQQRDIGALKGIVDKYAMPDLSDH